MNSRATDLRSVIADAVRCALAEDIGSGDVTAEVFDPGERAGAYFLAKQDGVLSGGGVAREVFRQLDPRSRTTFQIRDGDGFRTGDVLGHVTASTRALFTGERTALNFLQRLSGVATLTHQFVEALGNGSRAAIYDTRKTTPLLRHLEKQAVLHGGGCNHRVGLFDMAMLKNNHIDAVGGVANAVEKLRRSEKFSGRHALPICIEARNIDEAVDACRAGANIVMLDNMTPGQIRRAVGQIENVCRKSSLKKPQIEISGGITLRNIARYRDLPIDRISVGAITHSALAVDISFRIERAR